MTNLKSLGSVMEEMDKYGDAYCVDHFLQRTLYARVYDVGFSKLKLKPIYNSDGLALDDNYTETLALNPQFFAEDYQNFDNEYIFRSGKVDKSYKVVIIEGVDGVGKSTLIKNMVGGLKFSNKVTVLRWIIKTMPTYSCYDRILRSLGLCKFVNDKAKKGRGFFSDADRLVWVLVSHILQYGGKHLESLVYEDRGLISSFVYTQHDGSYGSFESVLYHLTYVMFCAMFMIMSCRDIFRDNNINVFEGFYNYDCTQLNVRKMIILSNAFMRPLAKVLSQPDINYLQIVPTYYNVLENVLYHYNKKVIKISEIDVRLVKFDDQKVFDKLQRELGENDQFLFCYFRLMRALDKRYTLFFKQV